MLAAIIFTGVSTKCFFSKDAYRNINAIYNTYRLVEGLKKQCIIITNKLDTAPNTFKNLKKKYLNPIKYETKY
ncbi:hypothetical protein Xmau_03008 [Xenorhabdus mauleonii]|uniref:Uncharacterized protein n=1 Tax=Xenorhabdus mauleonii TaxID=351675 RepID=A0A1I3SBT4_9GAMM|nr:hypothetical protein Xmau_03008 [Xenorhabdus mauleonii]SFJ55412.1 hypothetical protein SAMN05421680_11129 [Xenorhabdus mauleonii]